MPGLGRGLGLSVRPDPGAAVGSAVRPLAQSGHPRPGGAPDGGNSAGGVAAGDPAAFSSPLRAHLENRPGGGARLCARYGSGHQLSAVHRGGHGHWRHPFPAAVQGGQRTVLCLRGAGSALGGPILWQAAHAPGYRRSGGGAGGQRHHRPVLYRYRHGVLLGHQYLLELQHHAGRAAPGPFPAAAGGGERHHSGIQLSALLPPVPSYAGTGHQPVRIPVRHGKSLRAARPAGHAGTGPQEQIRRHFAVLRHPHAAVHRPYRFCGRSCRRGGDLGLRDLHRRVPAPGRPGHPYRRAAYPGVPAAAVLFLFYRVLWYRGLPGPAGPAEPVEILPDHGSDRGRLQPLLRSELCGEPGPVRQLCRHLLCL